MEFKHRLTALADMLEEMNPPSDRVQITLYLGTEEVCLGWPAEEPTRYCLEVFRDYCVGTIERELCDALGLVVTSSGPAKVRLFGAYRLPDAERILATPKRTNHDHLAWIEDFLALPWSSNK